MRNLPDRVGQIYLPDAVPAILVTCSRPDLSFRQPARRLRAFATNQQGGAGQQNFDAVMVGVGIQLDAIGAAFDQRLIDVDRRINHVVFRLASNVELLPVEREIIFDRARSAVPGDDVQLRAFDFSGIEIEFDVTDLAISGA